MPTKAAPAKSPKMSDDAVKSKTGKAWKEWFAILDKAGAKKMTHQEIVKYLNSEQGVGPWWQQMVTVTYEQHIGRRGEHQKPDGYEISVSRTIAARFPNFMRPSETRSRGLSGSRKTASSSALRSKTNPCG